MDKSKLLINDPKAWRKHLDDHLNSLEQEIASTPKTNSKRVPKKQLLLNEKIDMLEQYKHFLDPSNPAIQFMDPKNRLIGEKRIKEELEKMPKEQISNLLAKTSIDYLIYSNIAIYLGKEAHHLRKRLTSMNDKRLKTLASTTDGLLGKYSKNNEALRACLVMMQADINRKVSPTDYLKFKRLVVSKYPIPPVIPSYKRNKDERKQSKTEQEANALAGKRFGWSESTLRKFFEKHTGVKPSSVRK